MRQLIVFALMFSTLNAWSVELSAADKMRLIGLQRALAVHFLLLESSMENLEANKGNDPSEIYAANQSALHALQFLTPLPGYNELQTSVGAIIRTVVDRMKGRSHQAPDIKTLMTALAYLYSHGTTSGVPALNISFGIYRTRMTIDEDVIQAFEKTLSEMRSRPQSPGSIEYHLLKFGPTIHAESFDRALSDASSLQVLVMDESTSCTSILHPTHPLHNPVPAEQAPD